MSIVFWVVCIAAVILLCAVCVARGIIASYFGGGAFIGILPVIGDVLVANMSGMSQAFALAMGLSALGAFLFLLIAPVIPFISIALSIIGIVCAAVWLVLWFVYCFVLCEKLGHGFLFGLICAVLPFVGFPALACQLPVSPKHASSHMRSW